MVLTDPVDETGARGVSFFTLFRAMRNVPATNPTSSSLCRRCFAMRVQPGRQDDSTQHDEDQYQVLNRFA